MKKNYEKPLAEVIEFIPDDEVMNDLGNLPGIGGVVGGSISEDEWVDDE